MKKKHILFLAILLITLIVVGVFVMGAFPKTVDSLPAVTHVGEGKAYVQYLLPYGYDALEPHIDTATMFFHYSKHHAGYTNNLNKAVEEAGMTGLTIEELLASLDTVADETTRRTIRNNGGGFYNHNLYFATMSPNGGKAPTGALAQKIEAQYGNFDELKKALTSASTALFGSGWAWLSVAPSGDLVISTSANQDNPIIEGTGNTPILGIDVWEHAYYLNYKNVRADYVAAFFNVVDWNAVSALYDAAIQ